MNTKNIEKIIAQTKTINNKYDAIKKINGENFNIFSILNLENNENKHSYFIYDLLNPNGSHNQGSKFLKLFLKQILKSSDYGQVKNAKVQREDLTKEKRRIDFTIETSTLLIGIEMKIDADDQKNQIKDYHDELEKRKHRSKKDTKLYYLTLQGNKASEKSTKNLELGKDYFTISFYYDIHTWIEACIEKMATIPTIREGLVHYRNLIRKLTNQNSDKIGDEMENILKSPEDLIAANTIVNELAKIWAKKEVAFWTTLEKGINNGWEITYITENDNSNTINYEEISEARSKKNDYFGLNFSKNFEKYTIECEVYSHNKDENLVLDFTIEDKDNLPEKISDILNDIGFDKKAEDGQNWTFLKEKINFNGKGSTNATFELFDDQKFNEFIKKTAKEITELLKKIEDNKKNILKELK